MKPIAPNKIALLKAQSIVRSKMRRYITVLSILSQSSRDTYSTDLTSVDFDWTSFPHKGEFFELREAGFIVGTPNYHEGESHVLTTAGITSSGISHLAQLSDYLWTTSPIGKLIDGTVKLLWLLAGAIIGYLSHAYSTATQ